MHGWNSFKTQSPTPVLLYLDEIQYFNKKQQQSLLPYIEDNEWSFAVELISIPQCPYKAFQKHLFSQFFKGMREILFTITDTIYIRNGSWSAEPFTASDQDKLDEHIKAAQIKLDPNVKATGGYNDDFKRKISSDEPE